MNGTLPDATSDQTTLVACLNSLGLEAHGTVLRLEPHRVMFEIYTPFTLLQVSEVLNEFKVSVNGEPIYIGRAVVCSLITTGAATICEASLEDSWVEGDLGSQSRIQTQVGRAFEAFLKRWQRVYKLRPEYKAIIGNVQSFLTDLRLWLERIELSIRSVPEGDRIELEREIAQNLRPRVTSTLGNLFEGFEAVCGQIDDELQAAHRAFGQRQLHPHLLCAPFIYRTYAKPLGYAGDYEMMNMMIRNGYEGGSLYAKLVNAYLLDQDGPQAVRNRVTLLTDRIISETGRVSAGGKVANIFCVACGPAWEAMNFIADHPLADRARFELLDFNEETLQYTAKKAGEVKRSAHRSTEVKLIKNSVHNLLRGSGKVVEHQGRFDLIYCSGLYDYLNNRVCKALNTYFYDLLSPGGLLVVGNFGPYTPVKNFIEHFLEWFLIYRSQKELLSLAPEQVAGGKCAVNAEPTGSNIFLEVRKAK